jgi:hypothetical protein
MRQLWVVDDQFVEDGDGGSGPHSRKMTRQAVAQIIVTGHALRSRNTKSCGSCCKAEGNRRRARQRQGQLAGSRATVRRASRFRSFET